MINPFRFQQKGNNFRRDLSTAFVSIDKTFQQPYNVILNQSVNDSVELDPLDTARGEELQEDGSDLVNSINEHDLTMRQPEPTPEKMPPSRWRQRNPNEHIKTKNKRRRNEGRPYMTTKGEYRPPRTIGYQCECEMECRSRLRGKELNLFHTFWNLGNYDKQNIYLAACIHVDTTKPTKRNATYKYSVKISGQQIFICKIEFLAVHGLQFSAKRVDILSRKVRDGVLIPESDGRGKHKNHKRVDDLTLNMVREHIKIIPKYISHYSREVNPNRVYLDCDMNISELYRKYVEWIEEKNKSFIGNQTEAIDIDMVEAPDCETVFLRDTVEVSNIDVSNVFPHFEVASDDTYRRIFCKEFNIGFKLPRSDTCKTCDSIKIKMKDNKDDEHLIAELKIELEYHHVEAKGMENNLKTTIEKAKATNEFDVVIFDLQQALLTPTLTVGEAFYCRKALTYNFGVHNGKTDKGNMFWWPETVAKRGSDEVASCLWKYVQVNKPTSDGLIAFSDNCGGQNKNWNVMSFWRQLVIDGVYQTIEHRFLIPGHTRLPCDRDFALIEKEKKRVVEVFSPDHWDQVIRNANKINPFVVTPMKSEDFFSFEQLLRRITKKTIDDDKLPLKFREARCFLFKSEHGVLYVRHTIDGPLTSVNIVKNNVQSEASSHMKDLISRKYDTFVCLTQNKIKDLLKLMPYITSDYRSFYDELFKMHGTKCNGDKIEYDFCEDDAELI